MAAEETDEQFNRLDALLSGHASPSPADRALDPLLKTAATFQRMGDAYPKAAFARALEGRLRQETSVLAARRHRRPYWLVAAVAAAVLLFVGIGFSLTAAALAGPGSPLYGLRQVEQRVRVQLVTDPQSRAQLQVGYAQQSLTELENALHQDNTSAYRDALANFLAAYGDATKAMTTVPTSDQRTALETNLASLRARATGDLYGAIGTMSWGDRLTTTSALGALGNSVPIVKQVTYAHSSGTPGNGAPGNGDGLLVQIHGAGFAPGAVVYINGQAMGDVRRVTPNDIQVVLHGVATLAPSTVIGVRNPDGTAAQTASVSRSSLSPQETPSATPTATPNGHGDHHGGSGTGSHG